MRIAIIFLKSSIDQTFNYFSFFRGSVQMLDMGSYQFADSRITFFL